MGQLQVFVILDLVPSLVGFRAVVVWPVPSSPVVDAACGVMSWGTCGKPGRILGKKKGAV